MVCPLFSTSAIDNKASTSRIRVRTTVVVRCFWSSVDTTQEMANTNSMRAEVSTDSSFDVAPLDEEATAGGKNGIRVAWTAAETPERLAVGAIASSFSTIARRCLRIDRVSAWSCSIFCCQNNSLQCVRDCCLVLLCLLCTPVLYVYDYPPQVYSGHYKNTKSKYQFTSH
jgi:hypothetical protein